jgi:hypothetical protein
MQRREFFGAGAVLVAPGCAMETERIMPPSDLIPWKLWGDSASIPLSAQVGGAPEPTQSAQLVNINYRRPETWAMFFFAEILNANPSVALGTVVVNVDFEIIFGVGRTRFVTRPFPGRTVGSASQMGFQRFSWLRNAGDNIAQFSNKWSQSGLSPLLNENDPASTRERVEYITAQTIQCSAQASIAGLGGPPGPPQLITVSVGAFFAPLSHVRPDWFREEGTQFAGAEIGGT